MIINEGRGGKKLPVLTNPGTAGDLLLDKQLIGQDGSIITGNIPSKSSSNISVSGRTVTVPAGYYPSQASKSIATATQATPSITVSSAGLITASATQSAGYVSSGTKSATKQLTTQAGKTVTPGTSQQTAVASGRYTTGTVYVAGDSDLKAANIKSGVTIFGVAGSYQGKELIEYTYRDNITITRLSTKKIRINLPSSHPTSAEPLHIWITSSRVRDEVSEFFFVRYGTMADSASFDTIYLMLPTNNYYGNDIFSDSIHSVNNTWLYMDGTSIIIDINEMDTGAWNGADLVFPAEITNIFDISMLFVV